MQINCVVKFNKYKILLIVLIFSVMVSNFVWLKIHPLPPVGNELNDLFPGINFYRDIIRAEIYSDILHIFKSLPLIQSIIFIFRYIISYIRKAFYIYPPLVPVSYAMFYLLFGPLTKMELMVNSLYLAVALCSVYGIGKKIFNEKIGFLAAFIFSSFPGIIQVSRYTYAEFFSMCLITSTLYLLLKTDFFQNRKYSILLGISLGLNALAKWDFPPAIIGPFILTLWKAHIDSKTNKNHFISRGTFWKNFIIAILIGIFISAFWYFPCFRDLISHFKNKDGFGFKKPNKPFFIYYPLTIINVHIRFFYFILLIFALIIFIYKISKNRRRLFLTSESAYHIFYFLSWITISYAFFTFIGGYNPSHIMLILPALAIIISAGISSFRYKLIRFSFICLVALYGLFSHFHSFYTSIKLESFYNLKLFLSPFGKITFSDDACSGLYMRDFWETTSLYPPDNKDWKIKDILSFIKKDSFNIGYKPLILVLNGSAPIVYHDFQYYNLLGNYQMYVEPRGHDPSEYPIDRSRFDYIIFVIHKGDILNENLVKKMVDHFPMFSLGFYKWDNFFLNFFQKNKYKFINEFLLPYDWKAEIYKLVEG